MSFSDCIPEQRGKQVMVPTGRGQTGAQGDGASAKVAQPAHWSPVHSEPGTGLNAVSKQGKTPWPFEADMSVVGEGKEK